MNQRINEAATPALGTGEEIAEIGVCWATRHRSGVPLIFLARRQYLIVLSNRRLLVFERGGRDRGNVTLAKRFEMLELQRVRNRRMLFQVAITGAGEVPLVFEFRARYRSVGRALVHALDRSEPAASQSVVAVAAAPAPVAPAATEVPAPTEAFWDSR